MTEFPPPQISADECIAWRLPMTAPAELYDIAGDFDCSGDDVTCGMFQRLPAVASNGRSGADQRGMSNSLCADFLPEILRTIRGYASSRQAQRHCLLRLPNGFPLFAIIQCRETICRALAVTDRPDNHAGAAVLPERRLSPANEAGDG